MNCVTFPMMSTHCMRYKLNFETTDKKTTKQKAILVYAEITLVLKTWSKAKLALSTPIKSYGSLFGVSHLVVETWKIAYSIKNNANPQFASSFQGSNWERICSLMYCRCTRTLSLQFVTIRQATPNLDCWLLIPLDTPAFKTSHRRKILKELRCFCLKIGLS